jgi:hypothetical protein
MAAHRKSDLRRDGRYGQTERAKAIAATLTTKLLRTIRHLNSMGILTLETVPGLNRHFRNVRTAESSSIGFPVLSAIEAPVTLPLLGSTSTTQTPLPVMWRVRASDGYSGLGA